MEKDFLNQKLQKYFPFILIGLTILIGGYISIQKGIINLPSLGKKENVVTLEKSQLVDLLFTGKEYKLSYGDMTSANVVNIAKFDKTEQWQGTGSSERDEDVLGGSILSLVDRDRQKGSAYLLKNLNLASVDTIKFTVNLKTSPDDLETFNLIFGNKDLTSFYRFPMTNLKEGINFLTIPKYRFTLTEGIGEEKSKKEVSPAATGAKTTFNWEKIERIQFDLFSRPGTKASIEVDWIRAEKDKIYSAEWNWDNHEHFFNLDIGLDGKPQLLVQNVGRSMATLKKVGSVNDFTYSVKITSLKRGYTGLFFRGDYKTTFGYYLAVGGVGSSDWSISKFGLFDNQPKTTVLLKGQIANFEFSRDKPFWLKVNVKANNITAYFSLDGKGWTKLGSITDNEFTTGGIGVVVSSGGAGYFDEFNLST